MKNLITDQTLSLANIFTNAGFELRFVGGCVRDSILGLQPKDIDFCTNATPDQQIAVYKHCNLRYIETGKEHGTITVVLDDVAYEVTTLRVDVDTNGRQAKVQFTTDWEADLARRDLTVNAISMDFDGYFVDPFGGQLDIRAGRIRFVGNAEERVQEDYLRILRYFRFYQRFGSSFDFEAYRAIEKHADGLKNISVERIWMEMSKILVGKNLNPVLTEMKNAGVLDAIGLPIDDVDRSACPVMTNAINEINDPFVALWLISSCMIPQNWKYTREDFQMRDYLNKPIGDGDFKSLMTDAVNGFSKDMVIKKAVCYGVPKDEINQFKYSPVPVFPITGKDLIADGWIPGPAMGQELQRLKKEWIDNDFSLPK